MMDEFSKLHPIVNFIYFVAIIGFTMFFMHPIFLGISLISAIIYVAYLQGLNGIKNNLLMSIYIIVMVVLVNMLVSSNGETILFYIANKSISLESIYYSIASSVMFITVFMWFSCYNKIMTSDKFIYLFGKRFPSLSLIISMVFRLIPNFKIQTKKIKDAQKAMGRNFDEGTVLEKIKNGIKLISILITWALENSIETVDSMKARGYGLDGRSNFSIYKFKKRDKIYLSILLLLLGIIISGVFYGESYINYFPSFIMRDRNLYSYVIYTTYGILGIFPIIINVQRNFLWKKI
ncbi:energy-coupling factor transporter transmembrane component T [uncultured Clostridium sp.]|uniref:energy-coupling factor transporter transmembrane component T n=1 Tax=uncultured Clostridium sp. TaxID=59620 RepID=UPI0025DAA243|nr:energy-coupling factor transporter transmembrane component T [uncultured Clostridium sp.]